MAMRIDGNLQGHPAPASTHGVPGVEIASGALGQGLSVGVGCALGLRLDKKPNTVFCLMGDGELNEGQIWEAAMFGAFHKVDNVCAIVDYNALQVYTVGHLESQGFALGDSVSVTGLSQAYQGESQIQGLLGFTRYG